MTESYLNNRAKFVARLAADQLSRASQEDLRDCYFDAAVTELYEQPASVLVSIAERHGIDYREFFS